MHINFISACDKSLMNKGNNISLEKFKQSVCLFAFDNTPDWCHGKGIYLMSQSTKTLILMSKPTEKMIAVLAYTG